MSFFFGNNCRSHCGSSCGNSCNCNDICSNSCGNSCDCQNVPQVASANTCTCPEPAPPVCNCTCTCSCQNASQVAGSSTEIGPREVHALLNTVLDSCCTTEDVSREIQITGCELFGDADLEVGMPLDIELDGNITYREVNRDKDDCVCVSTVRFGIPIRISSPDRCCCNSLTRELTVIRSTRLCCNNSSVLTTYNSRVQAISAVISDICGPCVTITVSILFRSCIQQTVVREYVLEATPVCEYKNCNDARNSLLDSCDTVCGCVEGYSCPSC